MTTLQRRILIIGFSVFVLSCLMPPWNIVLEYKGKDGELHSITDAGWHPIFFPPKVKDYTSGLLGAYSNPKIDLSRSALASLAVLGVTGIAIVATQKTRQQG